MDPDFNNQNTNTLPNQTANNQPQPQDVVQPQPQPDFQPQSQFAPQPQAQPQPQPTVEQPFSAYQPPQSLPQSQQPTYAAQQPQPASAQPAKPAKKTWIVLLIIWLAAIPLAVLIQLIIRFVFVSTVSAQDIGTSVADCINYAADGTCLDGISETSSSPLKVGLNIFSLLLGFYGLIGWIPVLIAYTRRNK